LEHLRSVDDNKFTLWNHGTLPEGITLDKLIKPHSFYPRNPILAEACFRGGYIDSWGSGIMKIVSSCKSAGLPTPALEEDGGGFIVKLFKDRFSQEELQQLGLSDRQIKAIHYLKEKGRISNKEYQEINKVSKRTATNDLSELVETYKIIQQLGASVETYYEII
jgi:ATP-dependent DNA helicase RecG